MSSRVMSAEVNDDGK